MDEVQERVLARLVAFCTEKGIAGFHKYEGDQLFLIVDSELRSLDHGEALRFLLGALERYNLSNEFHSILKGSE